MKSLIRICFFSLLAFYCRAQTMPVAWHPCGFPDSVGTVSALLAKGDSLFAGTLDKGVYLSTDKGQTWVLRCGNIPPHEFEVYSLMRHGDDIYAGTNGMFLGGVYKSSDAGLTWINLSPPTFFTERAYSMVHDGVNIYMGSGGTGIYKSPLANINSGSWSTFTVGLPANAAVGALTFAGNMLVAGTMHHGVWRSPPAAASFSYCVGSGNSAIRALAANGSTLLAGSMTGSYTLYRSADNGVTWAIDLPQFYDTPVYALIGTGTEFYAGTQGKGAFVTYQNGNMWQEINYGFNCVGAKHIYSFAFLSGTLYAGTNCGIWKLLPDDVGIENIKSSKNFSIYPNPAEDIVVIQSKSHTGNNCTVEVLDGMGRQVMLRTFENDLKLNTEGWNAGIYYLRIVREDQREQFKLFVD